MKILTHKEMSSRGGKAQWKGLNKQERSERIKARWDVRRLNKEVKQAIKV